MTARKKAPPTKGKSEQDTEFYIADVDEMQKNAEASMCNLRSGLPDDLLDDYVPALAEKYIYARVDAICAPVPLTAKQIKSQLFAIEKHGKAHKHGEAAGTGDKRSEFLRWPVAWRI